MKPTGTIWGMPAPAVSNILQNAMVIAFSVIAARAPNFATEQFISLAGGILSLIVNQMTVNTAAVTPPEAFGVKPAAFPNGATLP